MIRYVFATDKVVALKNLDKLDPQAIGEAIAEIDADPQRLWQDAKNPRHPAHLSFEWDIQRAAEAHWTETARRLIRSIRPLDDKGEEMHIPAFVSIRGESGVAYRTHGDVMTNKDLRARVLEQAEQDILALQKRYRHFKELFDALDAPVQTARRLRTRRNEDRPGA